MLPVKSQDAIQTKQDSVLSRYIKEVNSIKPLDKETELVLATKFAETGDLEIANQLIRSQLRLVVKVAYGYKNYGISMMDIIAEGNLGLMHAIKKFNPQSGFRISTYATWWIKAYINDFILRSWSLVKIGTTSLQKRIFFNLGKIKRRLGLSPNAPISGENAKIAAEYVGGTPEELVEIDTRISNPDLSLNRIISKDDDAVEFGDTISSGAHNPEEVAIINNEQANRIKILQEAMTSLNEKEYLVFMSRSFDQKLTLRELSDRLNISKERVRQIEERSFEKVRDYVIKHMNHSDFVN